MAVDEMSDEFAWDSADPLQDRAAKASIFSEVVEMWVRSAGTVPEGYRAKQRAELEAIDIYGVSGPTAVAYVSEVIHRPDRVKFLRALHTGDWTGWEDWDA